MRRALLSIMFLTTIAATAQTQINPVTQVNWAAATGNVAPTRYCPTSTTGSTVNGSPIVTVAATTDVMANQAAVGSSVPSGAVVVSVNATTYAVTLSAAATTTASGVSLTFSSFGMPYTNTTSGQQYTCTAAGWTAVTGTVYPGVTSNGSNGLNVAGTLSSPAMVPTNITPSTSPVCANGTGGALTTTGCTGGTGTMTWPTFTGLTKYGGASNWVTPTFADVTALWTTCTTGWLKFDGTCSTPSGGGSSGPPNAVTSCGMDNTGTTPIDTALLACIAALPSSGGEIYFPPGVYLATSPVVTSAKNVKLIGAGVSSQQGTQGAVVFQSACAGGGDVLEFSPSAVNQQGPELDNIEFVDISGTGACRSGLHMLQTNNVVLNGVSFLNFLGKTLTETVSFASGGGTITGTGFTAAMTPAIVQVGGMNYEANYTNVTTLTLVGTYYGTATSPASAVIHWNGAGLLIDGGPNFSQFWTINRFNAQNVLYPYRTVGSKSAAMGTSANRINGGFVNCNRLPDSIGVWLGEFTDTTFPSLNINNCSEAVHVENSDANSTEGLRVENDSPYSIVSTCNGGVASVSCINDVVVGGDTASYTWGNKIIGSSLTDANNGILLMGNADRTVIANNSYRVVTNHYTDNGIDTQIMDEIASVIPGTLAVDGNITAPNLLSANVTNHFTVSQEMDALGTATSGTNYGAGAWLFQTSTWNGSAPDTCASSFGLSPGTGTNPTLYWSLNSCGGQPASLNLANLTSITLPPATLNTNGTANAAQNGLNLVNGTNTTAVNSGGSTVAVTCNNATAGTAGCTVVPTSSPALASSGSQVIAANTSGSGTQVVLSGTPTISDSLTLASTTAGGSVLLTLGSGNTTNITLGVPTVSGNLEATMSATTGSIGGGALIAGQAATGTATLTGATTLMGCTANPAGGVSPGAGFIPKCEILTTGTATVSVVAVIAGTPTATTYNVHVIQ